MPHFSTTISAAVDTPDIEPHAPTERAERLSARSKKERPVITHRKRVAEPHPRAGADLRVPDVVVGEVLVPVRRVMQTLETRDGVRGMIMYALFFSLYLAHTVNVLDSTEGNNMVSWFEDAIKSQYSLVSDSSNGWCIWDSGIECYTPFNERGSVGEIVNFVEFDLARIIVGVKTFCPNCRVGLSLLDSDLRVLTLSQMVCSDFSFPRDMPIVASLNTTAEVLFPGRDCEAVDRAWHASPSIGAAPCCDDVELSLASFTLLSLNMIQRTSSATLERLSGAERVHALAEYVARSIRVKSPIIQFVVMTPEMHAVGISYIAEWRDERFLPDQVACSIRYWSYFFSSKAPYLASAAIFCSLSTLHEVFELAGLASSWREGLGLAVEPFMLLIEWPTILLPWLAELIGPQLDLRTYAILVSAIELVMFLRVFQEGQVLPPFRLVVRTLVYALPQLLWFTIAMVITVLVLAGIDQQLFGTVDSNYSAYGSSFISMFSVVIAGAGTGGPSFEFVPAGATLMYLTTNLLLFLVVAQFFIAILVGSFDETRSAESARAIELGLPRGCEDVSSSPNINIRATRWVQYVFGYMQLGVFSPRLHRQFVVLLREADLRAEAACIGSDVHYVRGPLLLTKRQLAEAFGERMAELLVLEFGAEVTHPSLIPDSALLRKLALGESARAGPAADSSLPATSPPPVSPRSQGPFSERAVQAGVVPLGAESPQGGEFERTPLTPFVSPYGSRARVADADSLRAASAKAIQVDAVDLTLDLRASSRTNLSAPRDGGGSGGAEVHPGEAAKAATEAAPAQALGLASVRLSEARRALSEGAHAPDAARVQPCADSLAHVGAGALLGGRATARHRAMTPPRCRAGEHGEEPVTVRPRVVAARSRVNY